MRSTDLCMQAPSRSTADCQDPYIQWWQIPVPGCIQGHRQTPPQPPLPTCCHCWSGYRTLQTARSSGLLQRLQEEKKNSLVFIDTLWGRYGGWGGYYFWSKVTQHFEYYYFSQFRCYKEEAKSCTLRCVTPRGQTLDSNFRGFSSSLFSLTFEILCIILVTLVTQGGVGIYRFWHSCWWYCETGGENWCVVTKYATEMKMQCNHQ